MENPPLQDLLTALTETFLSSSTEEIKKAEAKLKQYEMQAVESLASLLQLLLSDDLARNLKKALVNYLNKVIISHIKKDSFSKEKVMQLINLIFSFLFSSNAIDESLLSTLCICLNECCSSMLISNDIAGLTELINVISEQFTSKPSIAISLYQMIVGSHSCNPLTIDTVQEIVMKSIYLLLTSPIDISNKDQCSILRKGLDLLMILLKKMSNFGSLANYSSNYMNIFSPLMLSIIQAYTTDNNIVSFIQKDSKQNEIQTAFALNTLKAKCILVISSFIQLTDTDKIDNKVVLDVLTKLFPAIFQSLRGITQNNKKRTHVSSQKNLMATGYEPLLYQALFLIAKCIGREPFYMEFQPNCFEIIFTILFQFLCTTKSDNIELKSNFEGYYISIIDAMYDFKLKKIKTVAGFLLSFMCDKFNSLALKVLAFVFQLLNYNMNELDSRGIGKYPLLDNDIGLKIVEGFPNEYQIDTALFCLCILAKHTLKNKEIKYKLKEFLIINQFRLQLMTSVLLKYKICLIYGLCLDELFDVKDLDANSDGYDFVYKAIEFLLNLIFNSSDNPSLSFQALHSLEDLIPLEGFKQICNVIVRSKIDSIINSILTIKIAIFFDVLCSMVSILDLEEWTLRICQLTVQRVQSDMMDSQYTKNEFIIKELRLIKEIIDKTIYNEAIEQTIMPILSFLSVNDKNAMTVTDEITSILLAIANNQSGVLQPILLKIFPCYIIIMQSDGGMSVNLFQLLNSIIINDKDNIIHQNREMSQLFNKLIQTSFGLINEYLGDSPSPLLTLLLIQVWLMNKNSRTDTSNIYDCINSICMNFNDIAMIYMNNIQDLERLYDLYMIWFYLSVIYSSFFNYSAIALEVIHNRNSIDKVLLYTAHLANSSFFPCKLAKCIILGLCKLLSDKESLVKVFTSAGAYVRIMFQLVKKQYTEEIRLAKKKEAYEIKIDKVLHEDSEDDEEDFERGREKRKEEEVTEREDNEKVAKCVELAVFNVEDDEFAAFSYTMGQLNSINEMKGELIAFEKELNELDKDMLKTILALRRIVIHEKENVTVPRKICKVKRPEK